MQASLQTLPPHNTISAFGQRESTQQIRRNSIPRITSNLSLPTSQSFSSIYTNKEEAGTLAVSQLGRSASLISNAVSSAPSAEDALIPSRQDDIPAAQDVSTLSLEQASTSSEQASTSSVEPSSDSSAQNDVIVATQEQQQIQIHPKALLANTNKTFFQRLKNLVVRDVSGTNLSMAGCCMARTVDEAAIALDSLTNPAIHGQTASASAIRIPQASNAPVLGITAAFGLMGVVACANIFRACQQKVGAYRQHLGLLFHSSMPNKQRQAHMRFAKAQIRQTRFEQIFAGPVSAAATSSVAIGAVLKHATPIGLYIACIHSIARMIHNGMDIYHVQKDLKLIREIRKKTDKTISNDDKEKNLHVLQIQRQYFYNKRRYLWANMASWGVEAVATGVMGTMNLAAWGFNFKTGGLGLMVTAPLLIAMSAISTLWTNNKITGSFYTPGIKKRNLLTKDLQDRSLLNQEEAKDGIILANTRRKIGKNFAKMVRPHVPWQSKLRYGVLRNGLRAVNLLSIGLAHTWIMTKKRRNKSAYTRAYLNAVAQNPSQAQQHLVTQIRALGELTHMDAQLKSKDGQQTTRTSLPEDATLQKRQLFELVDALQNNPNAADGIAKLLSIKMGAVVKIKKDANASAYHFLDTQHKNTYHQLFNLDTNIQTKDPQDIMDVLYELQNTAPCCDANGLKDELLDQMRTLSEDEAKVTPLLQLLQACTAQYLIFQAYKQGKEDIAMYAEYLNAFYREDVGTL